MKTQTEWWGIKLVAEDDSDDDLLGKLFYSLWKNSTDSDNMELITPARAHSELKICITLY